MPEIAVDPARAVRPTCLKPADDAQGCILRLWETQGQSGPIRVAPEAGTRPPRTDLLERDEKELGGCGRCGEHRVGGGTATRRGVVALIGRASKPTRAVTVI